jgi:hypothetical protein
MNRRLTLTLQMGLSSAISPHLIARLIKGCRGDVFAGFAIRANIPSNSTL